MGIINEYVNEQDELLKQKDISDKNIDAMEIRLNGVKTVDEVKKEVEIFLEKNNVTPDIKENLERIVDNFNENTDLYYAVTSIEDYMKSLAIDNEKEIEKANEEMVDYVDNNIKDAINDLNFLGIDTKTSFEIASSLSRELKNDDDFNKVLDNITVVTDRYRDDDNKLDDSNELNNITITTDDFNEIINNAGSETLDNTILEQQDVQDNYKENVYIDNGVVTVKCDNLNDNNMNFASMLVTEVILNNPNIDMALCKNNYQDNTYSLKFNDIKNKDNNTQLYDKVSSLVTDYNPMCDYNELLMDSSGVLSTSLMIVSNNVLDNKGTFQLYVQNKGLNDYNLIFTMDSNYNDLIEAFRVSGAVILTDQD